MAYLSQHLYFDPQIPITVEEVVLMGCFFFTGGQGQRVRGPKMRSDADCEQNKSPLGLSGFVVCDFLQQTAINGFRNQI